MKQISASVGLYGVNRVEDVRTIQELLNMVPQSDGGPLAELKTDGRCGRKTNSAIEKLQARKWGWRQVTSKVDIGSQTLTLLLSYDRPVDPMPPEEAAPPPPPRVKLISSSFLIALAARPGQMMEDSNFYFLVHDATNSQMKALYYFGREHGRPALPQPLTWSVTLPTPVTVRKPLGADDWSGTASLLEEQDSARKIHRTRIFIQPDVLAVGVVLELVAHTQPPSTGPGAFKTSMSARFGLVDASDHARGL